MSAVPDPVFAHPPSRSQQFGAICRDLLAVVAHVDQLAVNAGKLKEWQPSEPVRREHISTRLLRLRVLGQGRSQSSLKTMDRAGRCRAMSGGRRSSVARRYAILVSNNLAPLVALHSRRQRMRVKKWSTHA
jgi:hypothetical protein